MFIISANILTKMKSDWFSYQVDAGNPRIGMQKTSSFLIYQLTSSANPAYSAAFYCSVLQKRPAQF
jgi:hypothetical protein